MKIKKVPFAISVTLASFLVVGSTGFAAESDGNGNMINGNGMMSMMENSNMSNMMNAMDSPEGQKMMQACEDVMKSYGDEDKK